MSRWYEATLKDITFSDDRKEMHVYLEQEYQGAVYASLQVADVLKALGKTQ